MTTVVGKSIHTASITSIILLRFGSELYLARARFITSFGLNLALPLAGVGPID